MAKYDIVIVHKDGDIDRLISSINKSERDTDLGDVRIIVVSNSKKYPEFTTHFDHNIINVYDNIGWIRGANIGLLISTAPHVVLMNDDCEVVTDRFLDRMREVFCGNISCVGPNTNYGSIQRNICRGSISNYIITKNNKGESYGLRELGVPLSFFCVMFSRKSLDTVGYLDTQFGIGLCEDDDWQLRAMHKYDMSVAVTKDVIVNHSGSSSWPSREFRDQYQRANQILLKNKWKHLLGETNGSIC